MKAKFSLLSRFFTFRNDSKVMALFLAVILISVTGLVFGDSAEKVFGAARSGGSSGGGGSSIEPGGGIDGGGGGGGENVDGSGNNLVPLCGFAWAATGEATNPPPKFGVGWVDFNTCDTNRDGIFSSAEQAASPSCSLTATNRRFVSVDDTGYLNGYAWSGHESNNNIGWIKFAGYDRNDFPTGGGTASINAKLNVNASGQPVTGALSGWARALSAVTAISRGDSSWDGWISLGGTNYSVNFDGSAGNTTRKFTGYSWGSTVVGWLRWDAYSGHEVRFCAPEQLSVELTPTSSSGPADLTVNFTATPAPGTDPTDSFVFNCDNGQGDSAPQSSPLKTCVYGANFAGGPARTPVVTLTRGAPGNTLTAQDSSTVSVSGDPSALPVSCSAQSTARQNQIVTMTVDVDPDSIAPYSYTYTFNGGTPASVAHPGIYSRSDSADVSYSTMGRKTLRVDVVDGTPGTPKNGFCETQVNIVIPPRIIEI